MARLLITVFNPGGTTCQRITVDIFEYEQALKQPNGTFMWNIMPWF
jgi:hypothetical protein